MPIVTQCTAPGCETLTMGPLCVEHEPERPALLVRGRPWASVSHAAVAVTRAANVGRARYVERPGRRRAPQPLANR